MVATHECGAAHIDIGIAVGGALSILASRTVTASRKPAPDFATRHDEAAAADGGVVGGSAEHTAVEGAAFDTYIKCYDFGGHVIRIVTVGAHTTTAAHSSQIATFYRDAAYAGIGVALGGVLA